MGPKLIIEKRNVDINQKFTSGFFLNLRTENAESPITIYPIKFTLSGGQLGIFEYKSSVNFPKNGCNEMGEKNQQDHLINSESR
jgi:hypothetical protein